MVIDDLIEIAEKERAARKKHVLRCCMAAGCMSSNSKGVKEALETAVKEAGLEDQVEVREVGCMKLLGDVLHSSLSSVEASNPFFLFPNNYSSMASQED